MSTVGDADVIVIGSGAGGLTTAAYLAALGRRVLVVEQRSEPGGNLSNFAHQGYEFDIGLHYVGAFRDARPGIRAVLEPLGIELSFREQDRDAVDMLLFEDMTFPVPADVALFRERLQESFPRERRAIDQFLRKLVALAEQLEAPLPSRAAQLPRYAWRTRDAVLASATTLGHELDRLGCSPRLRTVLAYTFGGYGVPPSRAPLGMHALGMLHHLRGLWYPEGGTRSIRDALVQVIRDNGGELLLDTEVSEILVEGGAVRGVRVVPGPGGTEPGARELNAKVVVSAIDIKRTFLQLLNADHVPARWRRRVAGFTMTLPYFVMYLVLDRNLRDEGFPNRNWYVIDCDDIDSMVSSLEFGQLPSQRYVFITCTSLKDPNNPRLCGPGQSNLQIITGAPANHDFWDVAPDLSPGPHFQERKRLLRDRAVQSAERAIPGIGDAIACEEAGTPITLERHMGATGGTAFGIEARRRQFGLGRPGPRTPITGLFLAGASTRTGSGITGTTLGGIETASAIIGERADEVMGIKSTRRKGRGSVATDSKRR